jgi:DNA helicase-2/ATP-dependent DNA helicase PcrA
MLDELNAQQRRAAEAPDGAMMIVAGPGTGKTKTLVARIGHLVGSGRARAEEILALSFTHKAAAEMRARLERVPGTAGVRVGTFHSVALELLGEDGREFVSEAERLEVLRGCKRPAGFAGLSVREVGLRLSRYKNAMESDAALGELAAVYDAVLAERGKRDFDGVLVELAARLAAGLAMPWTQVLVDEFQDTSVVQYAIMRRLGERGNVLVIGDSRQAIYGFRGAGAGMFERFEEDYPGALRVALRANYRSGKAIVDLANEVFADDALVVQVEAAGRVRCVETLSDWGEADWVVGEIERLLGGTDLGRVDSGAQERAYRFGDIAVIYRTHRAARAVARKLAGLGLPYQVAGEDSPYGAPVVARVVACLRVLGGEEAGDGGGLTPAELDELAAGVAGERRPSVLVGLVAERLGAMDEDERAAVAQLAGTLVRFDGRPEGLGEAVAYLRDLEAAEFYDPAAEAISLLTIHAAKGLEFPVVFVIGVNEGVLPHLRADGAHDIDEERRLFYVATTRAKERLELVYARERGGQKVAPSRFLDGLSVARVVDPAIAGQLRKRTQIRAKRAQGTLF